MMSPRLYRGPAVVAAAVALLVGCQDPHDPVAPELPAAAAAAAVTTASLTAPSNASGTPIVLRGTIVTPDGVIKHGYVGIVNGRIVSVSAKQPDIPDAVTVNTDGIILPGFVDLHNHVPWNVLRRWSPGRRFTDHPGDAVLRVHSRTGAQPGFQQRLLRNNRARPRAHLQCSRIPAPAAL